MAKGVVKRLLTTSTATIGPTIPLVKLMTRSPRPRWMAAKFRVQVGPKIGRT